jgi:hypothetical protein
MIQSKNIHLIPTDKPSRLWMTKLGSLTRCHDIRPIKEALGNNINIYITSDEEIKEGDWFTDDNNSLKRSYKLSHVQFANPKKIIITDNKDLIKDGVQAIPDEFLEWFIQNQSCERVEVELFPKFSNNLYGIIIPQEEPKQLTVEEALLLMKKAPITFVPNKRMYSEEEVEDIIYKVCGTVARLQGITLNGNNIKAAFEKFKKK